jgi:XTP/dITP diphosphohydrolase
MSDTERPQRRVLLATTNPHKVLEVAEILGPVYTVVVQDPEAWETGSTFEANALLKAVAVRDLTGEVAVADDSGIEIDALGGMPGVYSSRWTNEEDWIPRVLRDLHGIPMAQRTCRYVCAAAVAWPDGTEAVVRGTVEGYVAESPRGEQGFGYDPIMIPSEGDGRTFGEMETSAKHEISHRGRAFSALAAVLASGQGWGGGGYPEGPGGGLGSPAEPAPPEGGGDQPGGGAAGGGGGAGVGDAGEVGGGDQPEAPAPAAPAAEEPAPVPHAEPEPAPAPHAEPEPAPAPHAEPEPPPVPEPPGEPSAP